MLRRHWCLSHNIFIAFPENVYPALWNASWFVHVTVFILAAIQARFTSNLQHPHLIQKYRVSPHFNPKPMARGVRNCERKPTNRHVIICDKNTVQCQQFQSPQKKVKVTGMRKDRFFKYTLKSLTYCVQLFFKASRCSFLRNIAEFSTRFQHTI